jgi:diketogulonate reductase-like aldo/keto reductase
VKQKEFGVKGPEVTIIGQGTWYVDRSDRKSAAAALCRGIELGMTHIDTAEMYGDAELVIADAIAGGKRDDLYLVSKVLPSNASRRGTIAACERSLKRLKTDHLDCYLLHWRGSYPLEDTVAAFDQLIADGKVRSWGQQFRCRRSQRTAPARTSIYEYTPRSPSPNTPNPAPTAAPVRTE